MDRRSVALVMLVVVGCGPAGATSDSDSANSTGPGGTGSGDTGSGDTGSGAGPTTGEPSDGPWARNFPIVIDQLAAHGSTDLVVIGGCYDRAIDGSQLSPAEIYGICLARIGPQGAIQWSRGFGGAGSWAVGHSIAVGAGGDIFATGTFDGAIDLGGGPLTPSGLANVYLASFDAQGVHRWSKRFGGACPADSSCAWGGTVTTDPAGNVLALGMLHAPADLGGGELGGGLFLASFDADGGHRWSRSFFGGEHDQAAGGSALVTDAAGNIYFGGIIGDVVDLGGGPLAPAIGGAPTPIFVASVDADGAHRWSRRFVPDGEPLEGGWDVDGKLNEAITLRALAVDAQGTVYFTGALAGTTDFGGGPVTSVGGMPAGNFEFLFSDTYLVSLDDAGQHRWSTRFGDDVVDEGRAIACDPAGNVLLTGFIADPAEQGGVDLGGGLLGGRGFYVASLTPAGAHRWSTSYGNGDSSETSTLAVGLEESIYLAGTNNLPLDLDAVSVEQGGAFLAHLFPAAQ